MPTYPYDSKQVSLALGGVAISGFGDADLVVAAPNEDDVQEFVGTDGEVTIAATNNPTLRVTITLAQSSASNDYLDTLRKQPGAPIPVFTFALNDLNGNTIVLGNAWVFRRPDVGFAKGVSTRVWQLGVEVTSQALGGIPVAVPVA